MERDCFAGFNDGTLKPIIDQTYGLSDAKYGLEYMKQNRNIGKIALVNDL